MGGTTAVRRRKNEDFSLLLNAKSYFFAQSGVVGLGALYISAVVSVLFFFFLFSWFFPASLRMSCFFWSLFGIITGFLTGLGTSGLLGPDNLVDAKYRQYSISGEANGLCLGKV